MKTYTLLQIRFDEIEKVYIGRDSGCRCGCHGRYIYSSLAESSPYDEDDKKVKTLLTRAETLLRNGDAEIDDRTNRYINISYGNDRAICIYLITEK